MKNVGTAPLPFTFVAFLPEVLLATSRCMNLLLNSNVYSIKKNCKQLTEIITSQKVLQIKMNSFGHHLMITDKPSESLINY